jgi:hypothetical protein
MIYFCCISGVILFSKTCAFNFYLCSAAPVLQLKAVDQDNSSTPAGQIVFSIVSTHNKFTIDPKTGWLATNKVNEGWNFSVQKELESAQAVCHSVIRAEHFYWFGGCVLPTGIFPTFLAS